MRNADGSQEMTMLFLISPAEKPSIYQVPLIVVYKGEKCKKLTYKRRKQPISILRKWSRRAELDNARVWSGHFTALCGFVYVTLNIISANKLFM